MTAVAVTTFETEPIRNNDSSGSTSRVGVSPLPVSARPYPRSVRTWPSATTDTVAPGMPVVSIAEPTTPSNQASTLSRVNILRAVSSRGVEVPMALAAVAAAADGANAETPVAVTSTRAATEAHRGIALREFDICQESPGHPVRTSCTSRHRSCDLSCKNEKALAFQLSGLLGGRGSCGCCVRRGAQRKVTTTLPLPLSTRRCALTISFTETS
jgi:hypothetical protein